MVAWVRGFGIRRRAAESSELESWDEDTVLTPTKTGEDVYYGVVQGKNLRFAP